MNNNAKLADFMLKYGELNATGCFCHKFARFKQKLETTFSYIDFPRTIFGNLVVLFNLKLLLIKSYNTENLETPVFFFRGKYMSF